MSFGKRATAPAFEMNAPRSPPAGRTRRGGYWLGLLTVPIAALICTVLMTFLPATNPTGVPLPRVLAVFPLAVLNFTVIAAVLMPLLDLVLRATNGRRPWIYALVCGTVIYLATFLLMAMLALAANLLFLLGMCGIPAAAGGWVMGMYRR